MPTEVVKFSVELHKELQAVADTYGICTTCVIQTMVKSWEADLDAGYCTAVRCNARRVGAHRGEEA